VSKYVLDASALLALLNAEQGAAFVQNLLPDAVISTVNLAEVVTRLSAVGMPEIAIRETLSILGLQLIAFDGEQAFQAGFIYSVGKAFGLSLGDRACLALARATTAVAVTADRGWKGLESGIEIQLIR
jgi:PIN domain nuclease of toxin-antitoxin system